MAEFFNSLLSGLGADTPSGLNRLKKISAFLAGTGQGTLAASRQFPNSPFTSLAFGLGKGGQSVGAVDQLELKRKLFALQFQEAQRKAMATKKEAERQAAAPGRARSLAAQLHGQQGSPIDLAPDGSLRTRVDAVPGLFRTPGEGPQASILSQVRGVNTTDELAAAQTAVNAELVRQGGKEAASFTTPKAFIAVKDIPELGLEKGGRFTGTPMKGGGIMVETEKGPVTISDLSAITFQGKLDAATGADLIGGQTPAAISKSVTAFRTTLFKGRAFITRANNVMDILDESEGGALNIVGTASQFYGGMIAQIKAASEAIGTSTNPEDYDYGDDVESKAAKLGINSARYKAAIFSMAIMKAGLEGLGEGRALSDFDLQSQVKTIAGSFGDPAQARALLRDAVTNGIEDLGGRFDINLTEKGQGIIREQFKIKGKFSARSLFERQGVKLSRFFPDKKTAGAGGAASPQATALRGLTLKGAQSLTPDAAGKFLNDNNILTLDPKTLTDEELDIYLAISQVITDG
jgi:hypothetical protein